jgi:peptide-methionine (R)-S-oxide reductase
MLLSNDGKDANNKRDHNAISRRTFLVASGAGAIALVWSHFQARQPVHAAQAAAGLPTTVTIVNFSDAGVRQDTVTVSTIVKSEDEWRKQLSRDSYEIMREAGTEYPYTNENPNNHASGVFRCMGCATALFDAATKFDSGTGWPSFYQPIAKENVLETADHSLGIERTAVSCRRCDAHLGHVFDDGPAPTGLRYCMNSVAMKFAKAPAA